jgi:protein ImuA
MVATTLDNMLSGGILRRGQWLHPEGSADSEQVPVVETGVAAIDRVLPGQGLRVGATHEWFGLPLGGEARPGEEAAGGGGPSLPPSPGKARGGPWVTPLGVVSALARRAAEARQGPDARVLWIGRRIWPMPLTLGPLLERSVFIDPECDAARFWAMDQALRCPGIGMVVADAMRLDMAGSRRLQLAAEHGGVTALLLRPSWERGVISAAETRWMVRPTPPSASSQTERTARWEVELLRCKGGSLGAQGLRWTVEVSDACALRVPADVVDRPGEAAKAAGLRIA